MDSGHTSRRAVRSRVAGIFRRVKQLTLREPGTSHALLSVVPGASGGFPANNRDLYRTEPAFRESIDATGSVLASILGWDAAAAFRGEREVPASPAVERRNEIAHHGMTRIALIDLLRAGGVAADGAIGISLGEVIAPYAVGAISRQDCARLVAVVSEGVADTPATFRVFVVALGGDATHERCRNAAVRIHFLGGSAPALSLVLASENDADAVRRHFAGLIVTEARSGWPYHTPDMHFGEDWAAKQLCEGITLRPGAPPVYSSATGRRLPEGFCFDARTVRWIMSGPSHFADAVSCAIGDGFDAAVQLTTVPLRVFADVLETAQSGGYAMKQFRIGDAASITPVRALQRRTIIASPAFPRATSDLDEQWWSELREAAADRESEVAAERLLRPLLERKPFDVVTAFADPLADVLAVDREELRRLVTSSVLSILQGERDRGSLSGVRDAREGDAEETPAGDVTRAVAIGALRTLLRIAPDFSRFQPLDTVQRVSGEITQLVIAR